MRQFRSFQQLSLPRKTDFSQFLCGKNLDQNNFLVFESKIVQQLAPHLLENRPITTNFFTLGSNFFTTHHEFETSKYVDIIVKSEFSFTCL